MVEHKIAFQTSVNIEYANIIQRGASNRLGLYMAEHLDGSYRDAAIVTDSNVAKEYALGIVSSLKSAGWNTVRVVQFAAGEQSKSLKVLDELTTGLLEAGVHRRSVLVALGGGVVCDTVGFLAASYMRGVKYVNVPTSLIAQLDASIGGKVAVNHKAAKNLLGSFWHPSLVLIDADFLSTLPLVEIQNGLAEAVKVALIQSPALFEFIEEHAADLVGDSPNLELLSHIISAAVKIKIDLLLPDPFEHDLCRVLNLGHTFAHALEARENFALRHGFAVAIGIAVATRISRARGLISQQQESRILDVLNNLGLPTQGIPVDPHEVWLKSDVIRKIRGNEIHFVVPNSIGSVGIIEDLHESEFVSAYRTENDNSIGQELAYYN